MRFPFSKRVPRAVLAGLTVAWVGTAAALEFMTVAEPAVLYDAPSQKAQPLWIVRPGTPVEAVVVLDQWIKVRDMRGDLAWIEKRSLARQRNVLVRSERAQVRAASEDNAVLVFEAEKDVVLELIEPAAPGWVKVRHRDGQAGFVRVAQVWGL